MLLGATLAAIVAAWLAFAGRGFYGLLAVAVVLLMAGGVTNERPWLLAGATFACLVLALVFGIPALRRVVVTRLIIRRMAKVLPRLGETERIALEAGTTWWEAALFSGQPDWQALLDCQMPSLTADEQAFLDGPVEELCRQLDDWRVHQLRELPPEIWDYLKRNGFFGMIIPRQYGGLGMSNIGHAKVVTKLASRSTACAVTVMVPNSLGPAELLLHYGTELQKNYYLPRLARGEEVPCFALTGPEAGSDAAAMDCEGVVERMSCDGRETVGIRLNCEKRYITLAPVATLIGLAFKLRDPDRLLVDQLPSALRESSAYRQSGELGITCALVPRHTEGLRIGGRHDPMGVPFHNGPIVVENAFVPLDAIIGGATGIGQGWRMLMECLAAGRAISLPALAVGSAQTMTRIAGAYATVREQFDIPIGRFEGIEEPLARIGGYTYLMTAAQRLTCGALDLGERPAVLSAIIKSYATELMRRTIIDAMDIRAGAALQRGPRNLIARSYEAAPIGITVEGANILTRSLIIYGQGAIRCHPFVQEEIRAIANRDLVRFDRAFFGHLNHVATCAARSLLLGLTGGRLAKAPAIESLGRFCQQLSRFSAAFALVSDVVMGTLGGTLKRREKISGRLADALAWMYLASAILKRWHDEDKSDERRDLARWGLFHALSEIERALLGVIHNLPSRFAALALRILVYPLGARLRAPNDRLGGTVARALLDDKAARLDLTRDIFVPPHEEVGLGQLEAALDMTMRAQPIDMKVRRAVHEGRIERAPRSRLGDAALTADVITPTEHEVLTLAHRARERAIHVDVFSAEEFQRIR